MGHRSNIPPSGDTVFVTQGGDDELSGLTEENPVLTLAQAGTVAFDVSATSISIGDSRTAYVENVIGLDGVDVNGLGAAITSSDNSGVTYTASNSSTANIGFLSASGNDSVVYHVNGKTRSLATTSTLVLGSFFGPVSNNVTGIKVDGTNDDVFVTLRNGECRATNSKLLDVVGQSNTAIAVDFGTYTNFQDGLIGCNCNSSDPNQIVSVTFNNLADDAAAAPINSAVVAGTSGRVTLRGGNINIPGNKICDIDSGLQVDLSAQQTAGIIDNNSGGQLSISKLGFHVGPVNLNAGSTTAGSITQVIGNVTIDGECTGDVSKIDGDLTISSTGSFDGDVSVVTGTTTVDPASNTNALIDNIRYGKRMITDEIVLSASSFNDQNPVGLDTPLQIEFGVAQAPLLDVNGTFTTPDNGQYTMKYSFQYGRTGAGGVSWLFFYLEIDGTQAANTRLAKLDNSNNDFPVDFTVPAVDLTAGQEVKAYIYRDSLGNDSGGLLSESPTLTLTDSPSAMLTVTRVYNDG